VGRQAATLIRKSKRALEKVRVGCRVEEVKEMNWECC
jgi:hypothetical protein